MPERLQFIDPAGTVTELSDLPGVRALGDTGLDMPAVTMVEDTVPGQAGSRLRQVRIAARDAVLPFHLNAASDAALRDLLRTLARRLDPQRGDGKLRHTAIDGSMRELTCRYSGGLEGARTNGQAGPTFRKGALLFRAHDPYWYDTAGQSQTYTTGAQPVFFSDPFFGSPKLASDTVLGTQTISNAGDVEAWPVWTLKGPASSPIVLQNDTTGQEIRLAVTLTAAQSVVIDARPFRKTVRRDDGTNLFGSLDPTSALWSLPQGDSTVTISLPGATADSFVTLNYARRWLSP